jgi:Zn-dependent protease with chaperone function
MNKLRRAACTALKGAGLAEGTKPEWFAKLPFILVDGAKEGPYDATYQNGIQQAIESSALVSVSVQLLKGFSEAELVWTLGHELGHGVNSDVGYKKAMDAAAFGAPIAGAILSSSSKLKALKGLAKGAALGAGIYAYKKCWYAPGSEKKADTYGLLVLEKLNYDKTKAIGIATSAIQKMDKANPPPPDKMLGCMTPGLSEHPSPAARIKNLQKFAAKGDSTSSAKGSAPEDK